MDESNKQQLGVFQKWLITALTTVFFLVIILKTINYGKDFKN